MVLKILEKFRSKAERHEHVHGASGRSSVVYNVVVYGIKICAVLRWISSPKVSFCFDFEFMFISNEKLWGPEDSVVIKEYFSCRKLRLKMLAFVSNRGLKIPIHNTRYVSKTIRSQGLARVQRSGSR